MKKTLQMLLMSAGFAVVPQVQAGWFDWFTPSEWFEGVDGSGLYAGANMHVTKATGQLERRIGGENDPGGLRLAEPGFITTAYLSGGWRILDILSLEGFYGLPLDSDRIDNDSNSQQFKMNGIYGVYLKPQLFLTENMALFARVGYSDFSFDINCYSTSAQFPEPTACGRDENDEPVRKLKFEDSGFAWSGGLQLQLSPSAQLVFDYTQHFDEDSVRVFGIGVGFSYLFGQDDGGDDFY